MFVVTCSIIVYSYQSSWVFLWLKLTNQFRVCQVILLDISWKVQKKGELLPLNLPNKSAPIELFIPRVFSYDYSKTEAATRGVL